MRFIEDAGNTTQSFGLGRVIGQIYAYLYFSQQPRTLGDMQKALGISKGSASTGVRQLEQWEAVKRVWVRGDRKDYYEAIDWFGKILKNVAIDAVGKKLAASNSLLGEAEADLADDPEGDGEKEFIKDRIKQMRQFQKKLQSTWNSPVVKMLLK